MNRRRRGFTLLEVMLTLLITGMIITAIGAALRIHLRVTEFGRTEVEQAQLARALLRRIADDLRSAAPAVVETSGVSTGPTEPADIGASSGGNSSGGSGSSSGSSDGSSTSVQNITGSTGVTDIGGSSSGGSSSSSSGSSGSGSSGSGRSSSGGSSSGGSSSGGSGSSGSGSSGSGGSDGGSSDSESDAPSSAATSTTQAPGVFGTQFDLQVDVTRPPRPGAALPLVALGPVDPTGGVMPPAGELPSDVKSVAYYVSTTAGSPYAASTAALPADPAAGLQPVAAGGLIRRQMPREAALFSSANGGVDLTQYEQLLAPEVTALEFRYFDGTEWLTEWDSAARKALPICVEIALTMRAADMAAAADPLSIFATDPAMTDRTYRLLVHLPGGTPSTAEGSAADFSEPTDSTSSTSSSAEASP